MAATAEYELIEGEGKEGFNQKLSEKMKDGWIPYGQHNVFVVYNGPVSGKQATLVYSILIYRAPQTDFAKDE